MSETVKAGEVRAERMTPKELGVRLFKQPPASFDPITAEPRELLAYGYPARPVKVIVPFTAGGGTAVWCAPTADGDPAPSQVTYELEDGKLRRA